MEGTALCTPASVNLTLTIISILKLMLIMNTSNPFSTQGQSWVYEGEFRHDARHGNGQVSSSTAPLMLCRRGHQSDSPSVRIAS